MNILIIGQGLAGSVLAFNLLQRGVQLTVADPFLPSGSTRVAAGVIRPITGRRMAKTYQSDLALPTAFEFYRHVGTLTGIHSIHVKNVLQLFHEPRSQNDWYGRAADSSYADYIGTFHPAQDIPAGYRQQCGSVELLRCGYLETGAFLDGCRTYFQNEIKVISGSVSFEQLVPESGKVRFEGEFFDKVVFCEGYQAALKGPFAFLPFRPVKGEILDFEAPGLDEKYIVNLGKFVLPLGNGTFRTGSTYSWHQLDEEPTSTAKEQLADWLSEIVEVPFTITGHVAGIRPAVADRRPILGFHPEHPWLGIFNGLGSKGVMLAPYYANQLAELIVNGKAVDPAVSIDRFIR